MEDSRASFGSRLGFILVSASVPSALETYGNFLTSQVKMVELCSCFSIYCS